MFASNGAYRLVGMGFSAVLMGLAGGVAASTLNDGVTVSLGGLPSAGEVLLAIFDNAPDDSPNAGKTLLVNTHWSYADIVNGVGVATLDLSSDPNFQAIQNDSLVYDVVGAYGLYQNPETGKANLDKNGVELPFDDGVPNNAPWGVIATGHAASDFSTDVNDLGNTQTNGVQTYWVSANTSLAGVGATDTSGPDSVLVDPGNDASWDTGWGGTFGGAGLALTSNATAVDGLGGTAKLFWITNPSLDPSVPNTVTELGSVQLSEDGLLSYTVAGGQPPPPPANAPPVATVVAPVSVITGTVVTLDGSGSRDPNRKDTLTYAWTQSAGPAANLNGADTAVASFKAGVIGEYAFTLTVTDNHGATGTSTAHLTVTPPVNHPPTAAATAATPVNTGSTVVLDGGGSRDPDPGDTLAYHWSWISGPMAPVLTGADAATARFKAATTGDYVFTLTVTDNRGASDTRTVQIAVNANQAPLARVSAETRVGTGATVTLDGAGSSDPDRDPLVYAWLPVSGPVPVILNNANAATASFIATVDGIYVFKLIVADDRGASGEAVVRIKAGPGVALNTPTTWLVGQAQTLGVTGFQLKEKARVSLQFSSDGQNFMPLGKVALKKGVFRWKPGRKHITRQGVLQVCHDPKKPATCDQVSNIVVKALPK